ncbi:MAG: type II toxin-antitoxin system MqsA family antitoxin [Clostridiales bacterium]|jgi:YgiT-type zinc finger domain-containing protein|nr:type II toxin-antitoxin system MqsA family antitoxin [Clostridiales bacterium]
MNCFFCKAPVENKTASFMKEIDGRYFIIKNVPSQICAQCGEISYDDETIQKLQDIIDSVQTFTEVAIINFCDKVA